MTLLPVSFAATKRAIGRNSPWLRDVWRTWRKYKSVFGRSPHLVWARTHNEKIHRRKLFDRDPRLSHRADKVLVKNFVESKLGPAWTTETLWHGAELPRMADRNWKLPFVLKANHGSGMNIFVRSPSELDWPTIEQLANKWLGEVFGDDRGEWAYYKIKPQLLIEPFIGAPPQMPVDYKLWVFGGRVEFIQVDTDREHAHKRTMFDPSWKRLPFSRVYPIDEREIGRPASLSRMIHAAQILAEDIPFVRVDFYEINGAPLFGEMTFYPGSGTEPFDPPEFDRKIGDLWPSRRRAARRPVPPASRLAGA